jgi:hypothetical protein
VNEKREDGGQGSEMPVPRERPVHQLRRRRKSGVKIAELTQGELARELDDYSGRISTLVRTLDFGILGLTWLFLVAKPDAHVAITLPRWSLLSVTLACLLAILAEFAQYLFGEKTVDETFSRAERSRSGKAAYDPDVFSYRAQLVCYRLKLLLTLAAAGLFVFVVGKAIYA